MFGPQFLELRDGVALVVAHLDHASTSAFLALMARWEW